MRSYKIFISCVLITTVLCFSSCSPIILEGLDEFSIADSSNGLTKYLLPDDRFLETFNYLNGDYHYYDNCRYDNAALEKVFVVLQYDEKTYFDSKDHCLSVLPLSESNIYQYKQYVFLENLMLPQSNKTLENGVNRKFPYHFIMFGYNDTSCELFFVGFRCGNDFEKNADIIQEDFGSFLTYFYSEYYEFD